MPIPIKPRWSTRGAFLTVNRWKARAQDLRPALAEMGAYMLLSTDENFRLQGRRNGAGRQWAALSALTIALRPEGQRANPMILQVTGNLRRSTRWAASGRRLSIGTYDPKAPDHHQNGVWGASIRKELVRKVRAHTRKTKHGTAQVRAHTVRTMIRLSARPIYGFQPADLVRWRQIQWRWIRRGRTGGAT